MVDREDTAIIIPTKGRIKTQITMQSMFLKELSKMHPVYFVVPRSEKIDFLNHHIWVQGPRVMTVPDENRFSDTRQDILHGIDEYLHVVIDDDMRLFRRVSKTDTRLNECEMTDIIMLMDEIRSWVGDEGYMHGGVSGRNGNNRKGRYSFNTKITGFHFYVPEEVQKIKFDFRDVAATQDFHFTLSMLRAGWPNVELAEWAREPAKSVVGGCTTYRTPELRNEAYRKLVELHSPFVKLRRKFVVDEQGFTGMRDDVTISWKKAFASSNRNPPMEWTP